MGPPRIILYSISFGNPDVDQVFSKIGTCVPYPTPEGEKERGGNTPVQVGRLRRPQVVVHVCVFCVRWRARKTHKRAQKEYLRRSRNEYERITPIV